MTTAVDAALTRARQAMDDYDNLPPESWTADILAEHEHRIEETMEKVHEALRQVGR